MQKIVPFLWFVTALNGGPYTRFTPAISFFVTCSAPVGPLGRGTPKSFSPSHPAAIREPDCETDKSSRSEVLVIWRW